MIVSELVSLLGFRVDNSGARQFDAQLNHLEAKANAVSTGIATALSGAVLIAAANIGHSIASALASIPRAGDEMVLAIAKIKSSLGDSVIASGEAVAIYEKLYEVSTRTGISAAASAQGFTQLQLAMKDMNYGAGDTIELLEGIQSAGIIAGQSTGDVTEVIRQLGQAFGKGKLNGDELVTLSERMPRLVREIQKEMNMTTAEFFAASEKGKLTPEMLAPALLKATRNSIKELQNFPVTMAFGYKRLTDAATRFAAELDKQLGLSSALGRGLFWIGSVIDSWRSGLSTIGDFIRELGGMYDVVQLLGISLLVAFGVGPIFKLISVINILGAAIARAFFPLAIFGVFVLAIEDFFSWTQGKNSFFGDFFGPFQEAIAPIKPQLEAIKGWFETNFNFTSLLENTKREFQNNYDFYVGIWESLKNFWNSTVEGMKPQFQWLIGAAELLMSAWRPLSEFFVNLFNIILGAINPFYDRVMSVVNTIKGAIQGLINLIPGLENSGGGGGSSAPAMGSDAGQDARRRNFGGRGGIADGFINPDLARELSGMLAPLPDVSGRVGGAAGATVNAPQSNNINNNVTVNAPAADPASVAAGASSGVSQATRDMVSRLGSLGLGIGMANPRVEAPAAP